MQTVFSAFPQYRSRGRAYAFLSRGLLYRTTSKLEDEAICIASILGFKSTEIGLIARARIAEERTQIMYTLMGQIPASILFNRSTKLKQGFRWAPATLIGGNGDYARGEAARCDAQGLHARFSGYIVTRPPPDAKSSTKFERGSCYIGDAKEEAPNLFIRGLDTYAETATLQSTLEKDIEFEKFLRETPK